MGQIITRYRPITALMWSSLLNRSPGPTVRISKIRTGVPFESAAEIEYYLAGTDTKVYHITL